MQTPITIANKILLEPAAITLQDLDKTLRVALRSPRADSADVYCQYALQESWFLEDSIIKGGAFLIDQGCSVRVLSGDKTGFAYSDEISHAALRDIAQAARMIANNGGDNNSATEQQRVQPVARRLYSAKKSFGLGFYPAVNPLASISEEKKIELLRYIDEAARRQDARVVQVIANLSGEYEVVLLLDCDNGLAADVRPIVRLGVTVIVEENGQRERGGAGGGARSDYAMFLANDRELALHYVNEAVRLALLNLQARSAPAGMMPVVLGSGWPAVLLHEAVGHGLEADFIRRGSSVYAGRIGEKVAASGCTLVDQGNLPGERRGSLHVDDEGTPSQCTLLIEDGILRNYMFDKLNARLLGTTSTGNGRRESYASSPLPRMTNTYMLGGNYTPEEIIASVDKGLYAVNLSGGEVDITSGEFVFTTSEAYLIEGGKVTAPVKKATLIGNGPAILHKLAMIGNDAKLDDGNGVCGKDGQSVAVGVGQPTLKISEMVVGGGA